MRRFATLLLALAVLSSAPPARADDGSLDQLPKAAEAYRDEIARSWASHDPAGAAADLVRQGEALAARGAATKDADLIRDGIDLLERAVAAGDTRSATWLRLARAHAAAYAEAPKRFASLTEAYRAADSKTHRLEALAALAEALQEQSRYRDAVRVLLSEAELGGDPAIRRAAEQLAETKGFRVVTYEVDTDRPDPSACLEFPADLPGGRSFDVDTYVRVEPAASDLRVAGSKICLDGLRHGATYRVQVLPGLPSVDGDRLLTAQLREIPVGDRPESVGFRGGTYILPRVGGASIPLETVNVADVALSLHRIPDRGIVDELRSERWRRLLDSYDLEQIAETEGEALWSGKMEVAKALNERVTTAIPVADILADPKPGLYVLTAENATGDEPYWQSKATQWFVITDIGLATFEGEDGLTVATRSLATGGPADRVELRLYARNNDELGRATTGADGLATLPAGLLHGTGGRAPEALMAFTAAGDFTFLDITRPPFDLSDRGVGGRPAPGPIDAFLYTERGVYRRGETVNAVALLRNAAAQALDGVPVTLRLLRPDGVEAARRRLGDDETGGVTASFTLLDDAMTGKWRILAHVDPEQPPVGEMSFLVEDVVPAQVEVALSTSADRLAAARPVPVTVAADYYYGAPAAGLRGEAELVLQTDDAPFASLPGYRFGLADEPFEPERLDLGAFRTGDDGRAALSVEVPRLPDTTHPLKAVVRTSVFELGGRPVNEAVSLPVTGAAALVGVKPLFDGDAVREGGEAAFEVRGVAPDGTPRALSGVRWELVEEVWDYRWFRKDGAWDYRIEVRDRPVTGGTIDVAAAAPTRVAHAVDWGRYRLEVYDPDGGGATSVRFHAGWFVAPSAGDTPDTLEVTLDHPRYRIGDTARVHIRAPFAGQLLLAVANDDVVATYEVPLPAEGRIVEVPVTEAWGVGAYLLATAFRPEGSERGPGRAIGLAHAAVDPTDRLITVSIDSPEQVRPRQTVTVPVTLTAARPLDRAYLTLAAVDEGILALTDYETPDPVGHFFGKRRLGLEIRDAYGELIDSHAGRRGRVRSGGDAGRADAGAPDLDVRMVSLFSGIVAVDAAGRAEIPLDLPSFNGRLRLMAVAWDGRGVGAADRDMVVRDPLVAQLSLPRFLAPEDESRLTLRLDNLDAPAGDYAISFEAGDGIRLDGEASVQRTLAQGDSTAVTVGLVAERLGTGTVAYTVRGPDGFERADTVALAVRPSQLHETRRHFARLAPGDRLDITPEMVDGFRQEDLEILTSFSPRPNLDVPGLLAQLDRYPYGCLEQTTSRAMPLLYVGAVARLWGQADTDAVLRPRLEQAVARVLSMQRSDGSFSLWDARGPAEPWLTGYALDFLTRAQAAGLPVPASAKAQGLEWLHDQIERFEGGADIDADVLAYAHYVLAANGEGRLDKLRYFAREAGDRLTEIGAVFAGAALALHGDRKAAADMLAEARPVGTDDRWDHYGSPLRDNAALVAMGSEVKVLPPDLGRLIEDISYRLGQRRYTSTQEKAWVLLAAHGLAGGPSMTLAIDGVVQAATSDPLYLRADAPGVRYENRGAAPVYASISVSGTPAEPQPPLSLGMTVTRSYYDRAGNPLDPSDLRQTDLVVAVIEGEATTGLDHQALIVDLLPAGFELENARLAGARATEEFAWLPALSETEHVEYRDDRFVAALDLKREDGTFRVAYLARAVTPGSYALPAVEVEDMYKPEYRARGEAGRTVIQGAE